MVSNALILLLVVDVTVGQQQQQPYIRLPTASYTEYCRLDGCAQNGTDVVDASGAVLPPAIMGDAVSANVSSMNASLFAAHGCSINGTDCLVLSSSAASLRLPRSLFFLILCAAVLLAM